MPTALTTLAVLSMLVFASACSSAGSGNDQQTSGVGSSKRLVDLTDAEKGQLCDWMVGIAGSYGLPGTPGTCDRSESPNYPFLAYDDQADCVQDSPDATFTECEATVAQLEACVSMLPACASLTNAGQVSACSGLAGC